MIRSILDGQRLDDDIRRENRMARLKRYATVLLVCVALSGLGVMAYHVCRVLSQ